MSLTKWQEKLHSYIDYINARERVAQYGLAGIVHVLHAISNIKSRIYLLRLSSCLKQNQSIWELHVKKVKVELLTLLAFPSCEVN